MKNPETQNATDVLAVVVLIYENHIWKWYDAKGNRIEAKPIEDDDLLIQNIEIEIDELKKKNN